MSEAMVRNTFSTLSEFLALVSRKEISRDEAKSLEDSASLGAVVFNSLQDHYVFISMMKIFQFGPYFRRFVTTGGAINHFHYNSSLL